MSDLRRYFDYNATTPLAPAAGEAWARESAEHWHNPSSLYREAGAARTRLEDLREELAERLGVEEPGRVVFTSGATEAISSRRPTYQPSSLHYSRVKARCAGGIWHH